MMQKEIHGYDLCTSSATTKKVLNLSLVSLKILKIFGVAYLYFLFPFFFETLCALYRSL